MGVYYTDKGTFSSLGAAAKAGATKSVSKEQSRKITENYYSSQSKTSSSGGGSGTSIILGGVSTPYGPQSVPSPQTPLITQSKTSSSGGGSGTSIILGGVSTPYGPQSVPSPQTPLITQSTPTNQAEVQAQLATFKAQSRPGFTTISQGGRLVNVPESPQYQYDPVSTPADAQIGRSGVSIGTPFNELSPERQQEIKDSLRDESGFVDEIALQRSRYVERDGVPSIESRQSFQSFPLNEAARREQARLSQPTSIVPDLPDVSGGNSIVPALNLSSVDTGGFFLSQEEIQRDNLTVREKDFFKDLIVKDKSGGPLVFPTISRIFLRTAGYVTYKTGLNEAVKGTFLATPIRASSAERFQAEILAFGFFSPLTLTTTQIQSAFQRTNVAFISSSQKVGGSNLIQTDVIYKTSRAGVSETGVARGLTKSLFRGSETELAVSRVAGATLKKGVNFPNPNVFTKLKNLYTTTDVSVARRIGERGFIQFSVSNVAKGTSRSGVNVGSVAGGITKGKLTQIAGVTKGSGGDVLFGGFNYLKSSSIPSGSSVGQGLIISRTSLTSTQSAITKEIAKRVFSPTARITPVIVPAISNMFKPSIKTVSTTSKTPSPVSLLKTETKVFQLPKVTTTQATSTKIVGGTSQGSRSSTSQVSSFQQALKQESITRQLPKTTQVVQQINLTKQLTRQLTVQRQKFSFKTPVPKIRIKPPKIIPFKFSKLRGKSEEKEKGLPIYIRRFGLWKNVGLAGSIGEAVNVGKNITGKTLARSFAIGGPSVSKVSGYKTKQEKIGNVFIQPAKTSLSSGGEKSEIKMFRFLKGSGSKKRRKKGGLLW